MTRDVALRIDAMVLGGTAYFDGIAHYMKNNLSPEEFSEFVQLVGRTMGEAIEISHRLHALFPDIVPDELNPEKARS